MPKAKFFQGIGLMVGMIFGAGVFALPFSIAQAGIFWGLVSFAFAFSLAVFLHLWYADIAYKTEGRHRLTGYSRIYLGKKAERLMFFATIFSYYGSFLVYGILGGIFLSNIFPKVSAEIFSLLFFLVAAGLTFLRLTKIATLNFYLTLPLFGFVIYLLLTSLPLIDFNNFHFADNRYWFLPFGVWLFSLAGFSVIPETKDLFAKDSLRNFKRIVFLSILLCAIFYFIFIFSVIGASGQNVSRDAISGLISVLGLKAILGGSILGLLAVFTSFLALSLDLRDIFKYDYNLSPKLAWLLVVLPPIILFFSGLKNFISIVSVIGVFGFGLTGVFIILMRRNLKLRIKQ